MQIETVQESESSFREDIEKLLGFRVRNVHLYHEALMHKSAVKMYNAPRSNERLEFAGDYALNLIIGDFLYNKYPNENEGFLTKMRTKMVSGQHLSFIAEKLELNKFIKMNEKALNQGWNHNPKILENTYEAIIGAIFKDLGLQKAYEFIIENLERYVNEDDLLKDTNYKDILMRYSQKSGYELPEYKICKESGPNHNKKFLVSVSVDNKTIGEGTAKSKKQAEQDAACHALKCLGLI
jgi:ribonuclease-3